MSASWLNRRPNISIAPSDQLRSFEELAHAVLVVLGGDLDPRVVAVLAEARGEGLQLGVPELRRGDALVREHLEAERPWVAGELAVPDPRPPKKQ